MSSHNRDRGGGEAGQLPSGRGMPQAPWGPRSDTLGPQVRHVVAHLTDPVLAVGRVRVHQCCIKEETMDIIVESVKLASTFHSRQRKKKSIPGIPKMGHLMEVAGIVQSNGGDEITGAAALLHDAIEDQGAGARDQIREKFGL